MNISRSAFVLILFNCALLPFSALACSVAAWSGGASGAVSANDPANGVPSVSGSCGFEVTGTGFVQDNNPDSEATFFGRFYYYPQLTGAGSSDIFVAYSDLASTELFSVGYNGSHIVIDATAAGGNSVSVPVSGDRWHLVEFAWESGTSGSLWVDSDATQDTADATFTPGSGAVETVQLGAPNGFGGLSGVAVFDDYISRRDAPIGPVLAGDANLDGIIDLTDIDAVKNQFLFGTYSNGSTDCNLDGGVNSGDVNCVVEQL